MIDAAVQEAANFLSNQLVQQGMDKDKADEFALATLQAVYDQAVESGNPAGLDDLPNDVIAKLKGVLTN